MTPRLPVDGLLPEIVQCLRDHRNLVLQAAPGAGKTTRVPPALLGLDTREVWVLVPRRLAARVAARRVSAELGEAPGETVGFQVRFENVSGPQTRLRFLTEGVLVRKLLTDPTLARVSTVILDEFHERHLDTDVTLALLRRLQRTSRPDLRIVVMSATLDPVPISSYLDQCPVLHSEGRQYEIAVSFAGYSPQSLEDQVAGALHKLTQEQLNGHVLIFLPGAAEISRAMRACEPLCRRTGLQALPLYGDLSPAEQDAAVRPSDQIKVIFATNVAESSITIEGVTAVIDSGLARVASDSPWTGLPTLQVQRISKASATQRAGRAGRTGPGKAIRLYSAEDYRLRPEHDVPELHRRELTSVLLMLRSLGSGPLDWFEPPPAEAWESAEILLGRLGAQPHTREMAQLPVHPRLARMILEAKARSVGIQACRLAALLSSGERLDTLDLLHRLDTPLGGQAEQVFRSLRSAAGTPRSDTGSERDLLLCVLAGFPDRVARRRSEREAQLATGAHATLARPFTAEFLVAVDMEDRSDQPLPLIRAAAPIEPDWLIELFPDRIVEIEELQWNRTAERVESVSGLRYEALMLQESRTAPRDLEGAARLLASRALESGVERFTDPEELARLRARVTFASQHADIQPLTSESIESALAGLALGLRSFAELRQTAGDGGFHQALLANLPARLLDEVAPDRIRIGPRQVKVQYVEGQAPWVSSRLQDFFGLRETPRIARGQVPLVVHLLAPNQRPVQTTSDLAGFWQRLYPQLRRELSRRYPRHRWPEDPFKTSES